MRVQVRKTKESQEMINTVQDQSGMEVWHGDLPKDLSSQNLQTGPYLERVFAEIISIKLLEDEIILDLGWALN